MKTLKFPIFLCVTFAFTAICMAQDTKKAKTTDDKIEPAQLVGDWKFESGVKVGEDVPSERLGTVSISEKEFTMPVPGQDSFVMAYKIDNSHSPAHVDLEITGGPAPPSEAKGIIALEDGKIKLCYDPAGGDRPESFESTAENGFNMFVIVKDSAGLAAADLVGTWLYASGVRAGEEVPGERLIGDVTFTADTVTLPAGEDQKFVMAYELDAEKSPCAIDLEIKEGPAPEGKAVGIIKIEDGQIVFCYDTTGAKRPESFESTEENGFFLFKLKVKE